MKLIKKTNGFTLIELMVVISIVMILFSVGSRLNFNYLGEKEKLEIFNTQILSHYEEVRNNALLGKGIGTDLNIPKSWKIIYSDTTGIGTQYLSGTIWENAKGSPNIPDKMELGEIKCIALNNSQTSQNQAEIIFTGNQISFGPGCNSNNTSKLQFETSLNNHTYTFDINSLNGIMNIE